MLDRAHIKFDHGNMFLGPFQSNYLNVKFETKDVKLCVRPYIYTDGIYLVSFFDDLAKSWGGWSGAKTWKSIEGDLCFEAVYDILGYANIKISVYNDLSLKSEWCFNGYFSLNFNSLENLAYELKDILKS